MWGVLKPLLQLSLILGGIAIGIGIIGGLAIVLIQSLPSLLLHLIELIYNGIRKLFGKKDYKRLSFPESKSTLNNTPPNMTEYNKYQEKIKKRKAQQEQEDRDFEEALEIKAFYDSFKTKDDDNFDDFFF